MTKFHRWLLEDEGDYEDVNTISCNCPLDACLIAEKTGEAALNTLLPDWIRTALANKWRPPAIERNEQ